MIYSCAEYSIGDEKEGKARNFRRNSLDFPDYFKDVESTTIDTTHSIPKRCKGSPKRN